MSSSSTPCVYPLYCLPLILSVFVFLFSTTGELLDTPARLQAGSSSTPFLNSSIFEPCPVSQSISSKTLVVGGGGGGEGAGLLSSHLLASSVNLATFKMPDPLPREKAIARLQERASSRIQERQRSRRRGEELVCGPHGAFVRRNLREKTAAARAASVVLGVGGGRRSLTSSSASSRVSGAVCRRSLGRLLSTVSDGGGNLSYAESNKIHVSQEVREICRLAGLRQRGGGLFKKEGQNIYRGRTRTHRRICTS